MGKGEWKTEAVRQILTKVKRPPNAYIPCQVCNTNGYITEAHHAVPIKKLAWHLNVGELPLDKLSTPIFWLCPNCHAYIHVAGASDFDSLKNVGKAVRYMAQAGYPHEQIQALCDLVKQAQQAEDQLYEYEFELEEEGD